MELSAPFLSTLPASHAQVCLDEQRAWQDLAPALRELAASGGLDAAQQAELRGLSMEQCVARLTEPAVGGAAEEQDGEQAAERLQEESDGEAEMEGGGGPHQPASSPGPAAAAVAPSAEGPATPGAAPSAHRLAETAAGEQVFSLAPTGGLHRRAACAARGRGGGARLGGRRIRGSSRHAGELAAADAGQAAAGSMMSRTWLIIADLPLADRPRNLTNAKLRGQ